MSFMSINQAFQTKVYLINLSLCYIRQNLALVGMELTRRTLTLSVASWSIMSATRRCLCWPATMGTLLYIELERYTERWNGAPTCRSLLTRTVSMCFSTAMSVEVHGAWLYSARLV